MDKITQGQVRIYQKLDGPEYPPWRYHRADQRHLGGAFQDNRVIPYKGAKVVEFSTEQQSLIRQLLGLSINYLPKQALTAKLAEIEAHKDKNMLLLDWCLRTRKGVLLQYTLTRHYRGV